jgi:hypothetical protein
MPEGEYIPKPPSFDEMGGVNFEGSKRIGQGGSGRVVELVGGKHVAKMPVSHDNGFSSRQLGFMEKYLAETWKIEVEYKGTELGQGEGGVWYLPAAIIMRRIRQLADEGQEVSPIEVYEDFYQGWQLMPDANLNDDLHLAGRLFEELVREFFMNLEFQFRFEQAVYEYPIPVVHGLGLCIAQSHNHQDRFMPVILMDRAMGQPLSTYSYPDSHPYVQAQKKYFENLLAGLGLVHGDLAARNIFLHVLPDGTEIHNLVDLGDAQLLGRNGD